MPVVRRLRCRCSIAWPWDTDTELGGATYQPGDDPHRNATVGTVAITVHRAPPNPSAPPLLAFIFEPAQQRPAPAPATATVSLPARDDTESVAQLQAELAATRQELSSYVAELEHANRELRATHEEAVSGNEELQASNEELESSKEELQSINEELQTVNQQLVAKLDELREINTDLANLFNSTEIATLFLTPELRVKRMTPPVARLLNLLPADLGRPLSHITQNFDGAPLAAYAEQVLREEAPLEREVQTAAGEWYLLRMLPYRTLEGRVNGVVATFAGVTQLKRAEQRLIEAREYAERIVETVRQPLLVLDADLTVRSANAAFYELFQVLPDETVSKSVYTLGNRQWDIPRLRTLLDTILSKSQVINDFEVEHTFEQIGRRMLLINARRIVPHDRILLAFEDITTRRAEAARLKQQADDLIAADRHKTEFIGVLGHELRNPLAALTAGVELLQAQIPGDDRRAAALAGLAVQNVQMTRLVNDLLDISRISSGSLSLQREPCLLQAIVDSAIAMVQPELDAKQHRLKVTLPSRPVWLNADPVRIGQVLGNLLSNAGKYTAPGGRLALRVECTDSATVSFYVRDNGVGIPSESLEQIFEPFCQLAIPAGQQREGLGVGLALVRQIVQAHGGHVEARSIGPGQGSEFVVQLPVATETPAAAPREPDPAPAAPPAARVLIVDDNIHITGALTALLKEYGWPHVRAVNGGAAALELARSFRPQVVLIDIGMPGMDGNELARQLRAAYPDGAMHLIAMTGFGQEEDQRRAEAAGFDQYLLKPVQRIELQAMIASLPTSPAAG